MELLDRKPPSRPRFAQSASPGRRPISVSPIQVFSSTQPLEISAVQFSCQLPRDENHTSRLPLSDCAAVLRRGNTLMLKISTSSEFSAAYSVSLTFGPVFSPGLRYGQFHAKGRGINSQELWLSIAIPANFPVGKFHPNISLALRGKTHEVLTHFHHKPIVILFNPWNPDDDTYIENAEDLRHHLLSDVGTIWRGSSQEKVATLWEFGQYAEHCVDVALYLLHVLSAEQCRSAAEVSRGLISQVNAQDNSGILASSLSGRYAGGVHPCRWTGSPAILQRFHQSRAPVRFGHCWVSAAVAVTLLRALGIAARPVTCYEAAHSCSQPRKVNRCFSTEGELVDDATNDQIWVYHVWCEAFMRRDDLREGYGGWQALDATPNSMQSGRFRVGPASVQAVREGQCGKEWLYGTRHIVSEVSAETRYLRLTKSYPGTSNNKTLSVALVRQDEVGVAIVTSTGSKQIDLTGKYRSPWQPAPPSSLHRLPPGRDCVFELSVSKQPSLGDDLELTVTILNKGAMLRTVDGRVVGRSMLHSGTAVKAFLSMQFSGVVGPGQSASVCLPIEACKYLRAITGESLLQFFVVVKVRESRQLWLSVRPLALHPPPLDVECKQSVVQGEILRVKLKFRNILSSSLSRVLFLVQAQQLCPQRELSCKRVVLPGATASVEFSVRAMREGHYTVLASMHCNQLTDVRGSAPVEVTSSH